MKQALLRAGALLTIVSVAACTDTADTPVSPRLAAPSASHALTAAGSEEVAEVSSALAAMNDQLAASGANLRVVKAEVLMRADGLSGTTSTLLLANDRYRGIGMEWVPGDPRRDGRLGVTYAIDENPPTRPVIIVNGAQVRASQALVTAHIEEAMQAWRNQTCSTAPIVRVPVAPGTDPDFIDDIFRGRAPVNYAQPADIVQSGFETPSWFRIVGGGAAGDNILGITFTLNFIDPATGEDTDIDHNGKLDIGLAEIYYTSTYVWTETGEPGMIDFYSIMTHETGHSLGLNHFGKLFVTKHALADGSISLSDIKYAPYAIMNAAYVTGRNEIAGTDRSSFCQIWGSAR